MFGLSQSPPRSLMRSVLSTREYILCKVQATQVETRTTDDVCVMVRNDQAIKKEAYLLRLHRSRIP